MIVTNNVVMGYGMDQQYKKSTVQKNSSYSIKRTKNSSSGIKVHIGFNASGTMAKIAAANTKTQVAAIERALRAQLKTAKKFGSDEGTIRAIKRTIGKAGSKVKALGKEERMENIRKSAKAAEHHRAEEKIRKELIAKRRARKHKERAEIVSTDSVTSKHYNRYVGNSVDVISEGIICSDGAQNAIVSDGTTESMVDVCL